MQKKIMVGLGVYLLLMVIVGGWYAFRHYYQEYKSLENTLDSISQMDQKFLDEIILGLAEDQKSAGSSSSEPSSFPPLLTWDPGGLNSEGVNNNSIGADNLNNSQNNLEPVINTGNLKDLQDRVSVSDRMRGLNIIRQRLSAGDLHQLETWLKGGVTASEKEEIKKLFSSRLSSEEIAEVKALYLKYR